MNKLWLVIQREYLYNLLRKSFIFTAFVLPLLIMGGMYLVIMLAEDSASEDKLDEYNRIGYVDEVGFLESVTSPDFDRFIPYESEEAARAAFEKGDLDAYIVVPEDYLQTGRVSYFARKGIPFVMQDEIDDFLRLGVSSLAPPDVPVERLRNPANTKMHILGEDEPMNEEALVGRFILPIIFAVLFIFTVLTTSQFLMSGVVEEKENRVMEILITSIRPGQLLVGKVIGLGALALTQVIVWLAAGIIIAIVTDRLDFIREMNFKPLEVVLMVAYFLLSFLLFAGIMVGVGASVTAEQEARQFASIFILIMISPSWFIAAFIKSPGGAVATFFSLFPFTSPVTNLFLIGLGEASTEQVIGSLVILVVSIGVVLWASVKIFHAGMLMYGQRLGLKQLRRVLLGGR
ncbi:MAG: ABC transporter permease [Anaerolineae bacterium]|nr:ABC transporter permease [Anaerolineae bacterium]